MSFKQKSLLRRLFLGCIEGYSGQQSETSIRSGCDNILENRNLYKLPKGKLSKSWKGEEEENSVEWRRLATSEGKIKTKENPLPNDERKRVYEYVRKKTYQNMNLFSMPPNDFLNHLSSVFTANLKSPVPKDPLCKPKVYNRQPKSIRQTHVYRNQNAEGFTTYREAIEDDSPYPDTEDKVLIWKIVVVNQNSEDKQK